ncbi:hypothetical protein Bca4012_084426 [Brassica carinata]
MPTRYTLDVDLKEVATLEALASTDKKVADIKGLRLSLTRGSRPERTGASLPSSGFEEPIVVSVLYVSRM